MPGLRKSEGAPMSMKRNQKHVRLRSSVSDGYFTMVGWLRRRAIRQEEGVKTCVPVNSVFDGSPISLLLLWVIACDRPQSWFIKWQS